MRMPDRPYNQSAWLITINSNLAGNENARAAFQHRIRQVFQFRDDAESRERWLRLISPGAPGIDEEGRGIELARDPRLTVRAEIGPRTHRVHAHVLLRMKHYNKLRLNYDELLRQTGAPYVQIKNIYTDSSMAYFYVHKEDGSVERRRVTNRALARHADSMVGPN